MLQIKQWPFGNLLWQSWSDTFRHRLTSRILFQLESLNQITFNSHFVTSIQYSNTYDSISFQCPHCWYKLNNKLDASSFTNYCLSYTNKLDASNLSNPRF